MAVQVVAALAALLAGLGFLLLAMAVVRRRAGRHDRIGPTGRRIVASRQPSQPGPPPPTVHPPVVESDDARVNRRRFLNRAALSAMSVFGVAFGGTSVAMLWPNRVVGFGGKINAGTYADIMKAIRSDGRYYNSLGRFYIVTYEHADDPDNIYVKQGVAKDGIMTLYQKCAHLGCRVPYCPSSGWFECPCHASKYNYAGEVMPGSPATAGLWRFPLEIVGKDRFVIVDTSRRPPQPPLGTDTLNQPPLGPNCVRLAEGSH